jgi:hypothetical protein
MYLPSPKLERELKEIGKLDILQTKKNATN